MPNCVSICLIVLKLQALIHILGIDTYPLPSRDQLRRSREVSFAKKYSESRMGLRPSLDIVLSPHRTQLF